MLNQRVPFYHNPWRRPALCVGLCAFLLLGILQYWLFSRQGGAPSAVIDDWASHDTPNDPQPSIGRVEYAQLWKWSTLDYTSAKGHALAVTTAADQSVEERETQAAAAVHRVPASVPAKGNMDIRTIRNLIMVPGHAINWCVSAQVQILNESCWALQYQGQVPLYVAHVLRAIELASQVHVAACMSLRLRPDADGSGHVCAWHGKAGSDGDAGVLWGPHQHPGHDVRGPKQSAFGACDGDRFQFAADHNNVGADTHDKRGSCA
jgi:hypothetical protein